jgi:hypothetical protein
MGGCSWHTVNVSYLLVQVLAQSPSSELIPGLTDPPQSTARSLPTVARLNAALSERPAFQDSILISAGHE